MKRYEVTFYQCGCYGIEPEVYATKREANRAASEFISELMPLSGHRRKGSPSRDGCAKLVDYMGGVEAMATVRDRFERTAYH